MQNQISIKNEASVCLIEIEGTIGVPEEWQFEDPDTRVATYERFRETVQRIAAVEAEEVIVSIRSTGGDVNDALLIHDALRTLKGKVTTRCYGYTASAATIIAQAASEGCRQLSPNALYLIHRATCSTEGNADDLTAQIALLQATDERLASLYADRSGQPREQFEALMAENGGDGRWLSPDEAIAAGLADTVIGAEEQPKPTLTENIKRGLARLKAAIGMEQGELPSERINVRGLDRPQVLRERIAALAEEQRRLLPTRTTEIEDPSYGDQTLTANELAYNRDAQAFRNR